MSSPYDLSDDAREAWKTWFKAALARAASSQKGLAMEIFGFREDGGASNTTEVNRFVAGEAPILRKWFEELPERAQQVAEELQMDIDALRAKLAWFRSGGAEQADWHEAFPGVSTEDVAIPAPLKGMLGGGVWDDLGQAYAEDVAEDHTKRLAAPHNWGETTVFCNHLELKAPGGASRDIALIQLRDALSAAIDGRVDDDQRRGLLQQAPPKVRVVVGTPPSKVPPLTVWVVPKDLDEDSYARLSLAPWGPEQAVALARRLSECREISKAGRGALRDFADRLEAHPGWTAPVLDKDLLIRWLAEVALEGAPSSATEARALLTSAAWRRAQAASPVLREFDEQLLDQLFAGLAARETSVSEPGPWTVVPRGDVIQHLESALGSPPQDRAELLRLVDALERPGRAAKQRRQELRRAIVAPKAEDVLEALLVGGVLRPGRRGMLVASAPVVAAVHAARGLRTAKLLKERPELLVDPDGRFVIDELARHGVPWTSLQQVLMEAPGHLIVEAAIARLRFTWCADETPGTDDLVPAWAAVLWAAAHGIWGIEFHALSEPHTGEIVALLQQASFRFRDRLPLFGNDPVEEIAPYVPEDVVQWVARWRRTPEEGEPEAEGRQLFSQVIEELPSRDSVASAISRLAPYQVHPARRWSSIQFRKLRIHPAVRLHEVALAGDREAVRMLTGEAYLEERGPLDGGVRVMSHPRRSREETPATTCWQALPTSIRLGWLGARGPTGSEGTHLYLRLLDAIQGNYGTRDRVDVGPDHPLFDDLVDVGERVRSDELAETIRRSLVPGFGLRHLPLALAWALAERLEMLDLFQELGSFAGRVLPQVKLETGFGGARLSWDELSLGVRLTPTWSEHGNPSLGAGGVVEEWLHMRMRAATALHRLGRPGPLRSIWRETTVPSLTRQVQDQAAAVEGLLRILNEPRQLRLERYPLDALRSVETDESTSGVRLSHLAVGMPKARGFSVPDDAFFAPEARSAFRSLIALLTTPLDAWPEEVASWLGGLSAMYGHHLGFDPRIEEQSRQAASALLELGDMEPLDAWLGGADDVGSLPAGTVAAVEAWLKEDRRRLDVAWKRIPDRSGDSAADLRLRLLLWGSHRGGWGNDAEVRPHCPRPFVVRAAMQDSSLCRRLHRMNGGSDDWAPVLRGHLREATHLRTRARWAVLLAEVDPDCPELRDALREWMLEDPTPWSGGPYWSETDQNGRQQGGTEELLKLSVAIEEDWLADGLVRLWQDALKRPWLDDHKDVEGDAEAEGGWWYAPGRGRSMPSVARLLVDALVERGRSDAVVDSWPPTEEGPVEPMTRTSQLRRWLSEMAPKHADTRLLRKRIDDWITQPGTRPFPTEEAWELFYRGEDVLDAAMVMTADLNSPNPSMLAMLDPAAAVAAVQERIERGMDRRYGVWLLVSALGSSFGAAPGGAVLARGLLLGGEE